MTDLPPLPQDPPADADWLVIPRGPLPAAAAGERRAVLRLRGAAAFAAAEVILHSGPGRLWRALLPAPMLADLAARLPAQLAARLGRRLDALSRPLPPLKLADGRRLAFRDRPLVMGIVNVTPDSFSDGGRFADAGAAVAHGLALAAAGADILDVGGESTRPGAEPVPADEELRRVLPVVEALAGAGHVVSIDTRKAAVARAAIAAGAAIVNDVSAGTHDPEMAQTVAGAGVPVVLMHTRGDPREMQRDPRYEDVVIEVRAWLEERIHVFTAAGVAAERIIVDPGIGFGKRVADNLALIRGLGALHGLGRPVMLGASRKSFIRALGGAEAAAGRLGGSLAAALAGWQAGVQIVRVHDVAETMEALTVARAVATGA